VPPLLPTPRPPIIGSPPPLVSGTAPIVDKLTTRSWRASRLFVKAGIFVVVGVLVGLGLVIWNQATRKDTTENYVFLCNGLFENIPADASPTIKLSDAEAEVALQKWKEEAGRLSQRSRKLAPIARNCFLLIEHAEAIGQNAPKGSKIVFGIAEAILGGYTAQRELIAAGGKKALQETERGWNTFTEVQNIFDQRHVLAVELADLGSQFSGPITNGTFVTCSFAEHKAGFLEIETRESFSVVNSSGRDLHNCVIAVRLSNAAGDSYVNYYFVPNWPKNERHVAQYSDTDFPKITVDNISRVDVSVRATEFSIQPIVLKMPTAGWAEAK
jgi:hypothetical protein